MMEEFKIGDRVSHPEYGEGIIVLTGYGDGDDFYGVDFDTSYGYRIVTNLYLSKVKETKEMTSYKVGDIVDHVFYGKCTITSLEQFEEGYIDVFSEDREGIVPVSISDLKKMTKYEVGDLVKHRIYNESIVVNVSNESGYINIVPLTEFCRGQTKTVRIENVKRDDDKLIISIEDYNEMANTIENLKKEKSDLQEKLYLANNKAKCTETILAMNTPRSNKLPEVKSVLYHKPATIIFWKDGTKTVVKTQNKEKYDKEKGFVMAYLKKILGNEGNYYEEVKRWTDAQ